MDGQDLQLQSAVVAAATTRDVTIAAGALGAVPGVLARALPAERYVIVADANTWTAAGARLSHLLSASGVPTASPIELAGSPRVKASAETSRQLANRLRDDKLLPIAVGSGVVNDLVKHAAEEAATPYLCVPTAASMDGYAASGAALRDGGFKRTLACAAPVAIVADLDVIAGAPPAMGAWGYGDLVGKLVAGVDWIVADALGEEAVNAAPFAMVQDNLANWLGDPAGVRAGDRAALDGLVRGLVMSGLAMQAHGNSRPASGSDHQFAHLWEMEEIKVDGAPVSHGACVGVGCLSMLAAYEWLQRQDIAAVDPARAAAQTPSPDVLKAEVQAAFPLSFMAANATVETLAKAASPARVAERLATLKARWPEILTHLRTRLPAAATVRQWLDTVGGPSNAAALGITA
ncbi:MAG: iron-containing alcohol dehydrogenase, partial [Proteobacteria bacterium]|nr:iron-containing alcohol dehydrogenase [Pseudomonadota bacterium]